jgi:hypothetical protein
VVDALGAEPSAVRIARPVVQRLEDGTKKTPETKAETKAGTETPSEAPKATEQDKIAEVRKALEDKNAAEAIAKMASLDAAQANRVLATFLDLATRCFNNKEMGEACRTLVSVGGNLEQAIVWQFEEGTSWELMAATIQACKDGSQKALLLSDTWRDRFIDELSDGNLALLVELLAPDDAALKLRWLIAADAGIDALMQKIENTNPAKRAPVYADSVIKNHIVSNYKLSQVTDFVSLLGGNANDNIEWLVAAGFSASEANTALGGLRFPNIGNFDFAFDGKTVNVTVKVKFVFEDTIPAAGQAAFKAKFLGAVATYWPSGSYKLKPTGGPALPDIPINFSCYEDNDYHKIVDVTKAYRRPNVISDMNLYEGISSQTIGHEFGHVLGLLDEYDGGFWENIWWWHDSGANQSDTSALMNNGSQLRDRYFESFRSKVQSVAPKKIKYQIGQ